MKKSLALIMCVLAAWFIAPPERAHAQSVLAEIEPNETIAQADASLPAFSAWTRISGAITPTGDKDVFKMTVASTQAWRFEVFDPTGADCSSSLIPSAMKITLLNSVGTALKADTVSSGIGNCPELTVLLNAGTYYVQVEKSSSGTIAGYRLDARPMTFGGGEVEPNDSTAAATPITAGYAAIFGDHQTTTDADFYSIFVPAGASIRAEVIEGDGTETCESNGIDSTLTLFDSAGMQLGNDGDSGRGFCSMIDGAGAVPLNAFAHNVAGGVYYLRVTSFNTTVTAANQFNYMLVVHGFESSAVSGACCAADGGCTVVLQVQCMGTWTSGGVCMPNPCPQATGSCCAANGTCTTTQQTSCMGTWTSGGVCMPNPCPQPTGACCVTGGSCMVTTQASCMGTWTSGGACMPDPCPQPTGACCAANGGCTTTTQTSCMGTWTGGGVCMPNPCPQPTGACCAADGACTTSVQTSCMGTWTLGGTCMPNPCPQPNGTCCASSGSCMITTQASCMGTWTSGGACSPNPCPQPAGACCNPQTGACTVAANTICTTLGGSFQGGLTACMPSPCPAPRGACCHGATCALTTGAAACMGTYLGDNTACNPTGRSGPLNACCPSDFNNSGAVSVQDIFDFLAAYFAGCP